jgi:hypothetical protein
VLAVSLSVAVAIALVVTIDAVTDRLTAPRSSPPVAAAPGPSSRID